MIIPIEIEHTLMECVYVTKLKDKLQQKKPANKLPNTTKIYNYNQFTSQAQ